MIGKTILHYKILEKLGEGGMGVVYKAEDTKLDRTVALKFLPHQLTTSDTERVRFLQEAKAASALNHNNVCTIHDIKELENEQFIVMEYVDGVTLQQKIQASPLSLQEVISYALQIGDALREAHTNGIVHRDIKSENIMVNSKNQIKVMDFGLAKLKGSLKLTQTSSTVGTLAYMAPEQVQGKTVDARADIFSFGVVLYEMLAGQLPFQGDYEAAIVYSIVNEEPEPIRKQRPEITSEFLHVLNRALEKDSEDRYQSVNDMVIDLRRVEKESSTCSRSVASTARQTGDTSGRPRSRIRKAFMALVTVLLLTAVSYLGYRFTRKAPIEGKSVAITFIENQTGDKSNDEQINNIIPQVYKKLFGSHKNVSLASPAVRLELETLQRQESLDKIAATDVLNKAGVKYRVNAVVQVSDTGLDYILEMTKPGDHPIVWQETLVKPDSVTSADFSQRLADWIEASMWVDEMEGRIHTDLNYRDVYTTREIYTHWLGNSVFATRQFYQGWYYWMTAGSRVAIPYFEKALQIDPDFLHAAMCLTMCYGNTGRTEDRNALLQYWNERLESLNRLERFWLDYMYNYYLGTHEKAINAMRGLIEEDTYPDLYYYLLGGQYQQVGDYENASLMFEKHIEVGLYPTWVGMYTQLRRCYNNLGLWDKALQALHIGLERNPESRALMSVLMQQHLMLGNTKEADKWFAKYEMVSRVQASGLAQGHMNYGDHFLTLSDFEKADDHYQKALSSLGITERQKIRVALKYIIHSNEEIYRRGRYPV
jgi:serine/threonine protein kinase